MQIIVEKDAESNGGQNRENLKNVNVLLNLFHETEQSIIRI